MLTINIEDLNMTFTSHTFAPLSSANTPNSDQCVLARLTSFCQYLSSIDGLSPDQTKGLDSLISSTQVQIAEYNNKRNKIF